MDALGPYPGSGHIWAVAVSGGADSMALLLLAKRYAAMHHGHIVALTIDHQLRPDSTAEATQVAAWAKQHGIRHHILQWHHPPMKTHLQQQAREARYKLLSTWCQQQGIWHLLFAHHAHDQAETILMRQWYGSGIIGLAGMPMTRLWRQIRLLRPLLAIEPTALRSWLKTQKQPWIEDPSNQANHYTRIRARQLLTRSHPEVREQLLATATLAARQRQEYERQATTWMAQSLYLSPLGFIQTNYHSFAMLGLEAQLLACSHITMVIGGSDTPPRAASLLHLFKQWQHHPIGKRTLGGCIWQWLRDGRLLVYREPCKIPSAISLSPTSSLWWDQRFLITLAGTAPERNVVIAPLSPHWANQHRRELILLKFIPKAIIPTLPIVLYLDMVVAAPHISYYHDSFWNQALQIKFVPPRPLMGPVFQSMELCLGINACILKDVGE